MDKLVFGLLSISMRLATSIWKLVNTERAEVDSGNPAKQRKSFPTLQLYLLTVNQGRSDDGNQMMTSHLLLLDLQNYDKWSLEFDQLY